LTILIIVSFLSVSGFNLLFHWNWLVGNNLVIFLINFMIIYVCIWIALRTYWRLTAQRINAQLKFRRMNKSKEEPK